MKDDDDLRRALRESAPADGGARERAWRTVRAAYDEHEPQPPRRRGAALAVMMAAVAAAAIALAAVSAPGEAVARWAKQVLGVGTENAEPALTRLPGGGRLAVTSPAGAWVVGSDGAKRSLGDYDGVEWSPNGLFVVAWRANQLTAVEPSGRVRWSLARPEPIHGAAWAPVDGFRVAYLAGPVLRIVNGDGTDDRPYDAADPRVVPAWRPDDVHVVAYVDRTRRIRVAAVDARERLWRSARLDGVHKLAWSPDGRRLLAVGRSRMTLFSRSGELLRQRRVRGDAEALDAAWSPDGRNIAITRYSRATGQSSAVLLDRDLASDARTLFSGPGHFPQLAWSPEGQWLLVPWREADQWLFLRARGRSRVTAVADIARQFSPGTRGASFPGSVAWCCGP